MSRWILCFAALVFGGLGGWLLFEPQRLDEWVGLRASTAAATTELRAFYGGLELGIAAFLVFCALGAGRARLGCTALAFLSGGIAIARSVGFVLDGSADGMGFAFLGTEVLLLTLGVIGARRGV